MRWIRDSRNQLTTCGYKYRYWTAATGEVTDVDSNAMEEDDKDEE